jgi:hypothetical protein
MKKRFAASLLLVILIIALPSIVLASSRPTARLTITPQLCIIDIVQDGSGQTLQSPLRDCDAAALPILFSNPQSQSTRRPNALFAIPVEGQKSAQEASRPTSLGIEGTLTRIANIDPTQTPTSSPAPSELTTIVLGTTLAVGTIATGVDIAVFELRYSRRLFVTVRRYITLLKR